MCHILQNLQRQLKYVHCVFHLLHTDQTMKKDTKQTIVLIFLVTMAFVDRTKAVKIHRYGKCIYKELSTIPLVFL